MFSEMFERANPEIACAGAKTTSEKIHDLFDIVCNYINEPVLLYLASTLTIS
jgi:hypothetical protein